MALAKAYLRLPQTLALTLATAAATAWVAPAAQAQSAAQLIRAEVNRRAAEGVAMGQTGSLLLLESELGAASQRQGELRNGGRGGLWARAGGSRFKVDGDDAGQFDNDVGYGAIGGDYGWDLSTGKLYLGAFVGLGSADQDDNDIMKGKSRTKYLGTYLTYVDTSGFYVDAVSNVGRIKDEVKFDLPANLGTYSDSNKHTTYTGSVELGYHYKLENQWFVEPQLQAIYTRSSQTSVQGRAGLRAGRDFSLSSGTTVRPYMTASYLHQFSNDDKIKFGNSTYDVELPGDRWQLGGGVQVDSGPHRGFADLRYGRGDIVKRELTLNVGYAFRF
ncbi:hypothetical protein CAL27_19745 [Bordetella genomosp. 1]|uniref:Autotransporter domain-containing protein n=1 Tax=Bordetella genomosp. 1 TaxID=1395607 RepID=A0ABX4EWP8_9BORD|nr:hypothetical protein CAL27_19745 [Bordetella genomosp. 1]